jgi:predicted membrane protein
MERIDDQQPQRPRNISALAFGILIIALGFLWLLRNAGLLPEAIWDVIFTWEMLLIAIGAVMLFDRGSRVFGIILIAVGGFFLIADYADFPFNFWQLFWPLMLIVIGAYLVFGSWRFLRRRSMIDGQDVSDMIDEVSIFGGSEKQIITESFKGGRAVSIFGGSKIDLRQSELSDNAEIEVTAIFGGTNFIIPPEWNVRIESTNIFGGYSDKRPKVESKTRETLVIKGLALFGGGEIQSY